MNVFHTYTLRSLRLNPTRTIVTVIGVILSMSMFTATAAAVHSGMQFLIRNETATNGAWHGIYAGLSAEEAEEAKKDAGVRTAAAVSTVGWAEADTENGYKPYLLIRSMDADFPALAGVCLTEGRMPENGNEILLPEHLRDPANGGRAFRVGDTITLAVGDRVAAGKTLTEEDPFDDEGSETIADAESRTYTVVGAYNRLSFEIEKNWCAGYTALTTGDAGSAYDVFFSVKNPLRFEKTYALFGETHMGGRHGDLLSLQGGIRNSAIRNTVYGFAAILFALIAFGSVSLIYNAFAISVSERTRQYGILKSVGATKKQLRASVLFEALVLAAVGIPVGALAGLGGIGVTFYFLRDSFSRLLSSNAGASETLRLRVNAPAILIAAALCLASILISAYIPAKRAMKQSPIEAIRSANDVKLTAKDVRGGKLSRKLFGFEGMLAAKNFRRSRRRYRAVVLSLFLSVVLFISATSLCSYMKRSLGAYTADDIGADLALGLRDQTIAESEKTLRTLAATQGVDAAYAFIMESAPLRIPAQALTPEAAANKAEDKIYFTVCFADDAFFDELCRMNGIDRAPFYEQGAARGLLLNHITDRVFSEKGDMTFREYDVIAPGALPLETAAHFVNYAPDDSEIYLGTETDDAGNTVYLFCPDDAYMAAIDAESEPDPADVIRRSEAEATTAAAFTIEDVVTDAPLTPDTSQPTVFLPFSAANAVFPAGFPYSYFANTTYSMTAPNHKTVETQVRETLQSMGLSADRLINLAEQKELMRTVVLILSVFSYGFITLISLIAAANVFNTISTNVSLRRREFAMLRSIGISQKSFRKMMDLECLSYGCRGLLLGLPASVLVSYALFRVASQSVSFRFYLPWHAIAIAVGSVFLVVFAAMLYASGKIRKDNPIDALRNENL